jgi:parallel beta-helix repeat protein
MFARISKQFQTKWARFRKKPTRMPGAKLQLEALEGRVVPATLKVGATETFKTIQSAVTAAAESGTSNTIEIDAGTYNEQVTIPSTVTTTDSLVIEATSTKSEPTVKPTGTLTGNQAIFDVDGATGVTLKNLVINGSGTSSAWFGVFVEGGGSATIEDDTIENMAATASTGNDTGFGVRVGRSSLSGQPATTGTATVSNDTITGYGKGGVDVANTGSSATVSDNTVTGLGHKVSDNVDQVQNGIEIDDGATGVVSGNNVTKNGSALTGFGSAGILLYQPGSGVVVSSNNLTSNDVGIWAFDAASLVVSNNDITKSTIYGIAFDTAGGSGVTDAVVSNNDSQNNIGEGMDIANTSGSVFSNNDVTGNGESGFVLSNNTTNNIVSNNTITNNAMWGLLVADANLNNPNYFTYLTTSTASGNMISQNSITGNNTSKTSGVFDATDYSIGSGTAGTADTWSQNTIGTKNPSGLD